MRRFYLTAAVLLCTAGPLRAALINGGFEEPDVPSASLFPELVPEGSVPGWETTASDGLIEIWRNGFFDRFSGNTFLAFEGDQFAELNANFESTLFQDAGGIPQGSLVGFQFAHRGRFGVDVMQLTITDLGADNQVDGSGLNADTILFQQSYSDDNTAWGLYTNSTPITALGNTVRFAYESISAAGGNTQGNFLDAADFGVGVGNVVPEPSSFALFLIGSTLTGVFAVVRQRRKEVLKRG